jgi:hypothetical protein
MESESLRNIRTMRQAKSSLDIAKAQRIKRTNGLNRKTDQISSSDKPIDRTMERTLSNEKRRSAAFEASVEKSRKRLLQLRDKLALVIDRNEMLMEMRHDLQKKAHSEHTAPTAQVAKAPHKFNEIELKY